MARLAIRSVIYDGDNYSFVMENIPDGLVMVEGDNGTGKTTFCDFIYFGLSGTVEEFIRDSNERHEEITSDTNNFVRLEIEIDGVPYSLQRFIGANDIAVIEKGKDAALLAIHRRPGVDVFSDWIMNKLGITPMSINYLAGSGVINFLDLMRLIYHDQGAGTGEIMKTPEKKGALFSDSKIFRRAVFEILTGKHFNKLYDSVSDLKKSEAQVSVVKQKLEAIEVTIKDLNETGLSKATSKQLKSQIDDVENQLTIIRQRREVVKKGAAKEGHSTQELEQSRHRVQSIERKMLADQVNIRSAEGEIINLLSVKEQLSLEISQVKKITYVHGQLKLFTPDTCPYCLCTVDRKIGKCICGTDVDPAKYERFFYNSSEYAEIIRSKQKNLKSIDTAIAAATNDLDKSKKSIVALKEERESLTLRIEELVDEVGFSVNNSEISSIDDRILSLQEKKLALDSELKLIEIKEQYDQDLNTIQIELTPKRAVVKELTGAAEREMSDVVKKFSQKYNDLCVVAINNCTAARINSDFEPILNDGKYMEDSAVVAKRLMYYYTLLYLSLTDDSISFPRFLLIDTPETLGVSVPNLKVALGTLFSLVPEDKKESYQVIMTTGLGRYPDEFLPHRILLISDQKLLVKKK